MNAIGTVSIATCWGGEYDGYWTREVLASLDSRKIEAFVAERKVELAKDQAFWNVLHKAFMEYADANPIVNTVKWDPASFEGADRYLAETHRLDMIFQAGWYPLYVVICKEHGREPLVLEDMPLSQMTGEPHDAIRGWEILTVPLI